MDEFNPDDWELHWEKNDESASLNPAQAYRHRIVSGEVEARQPHSLVDIGCGQGDFLRHLSIRLSGTALRGVELSSAGVQLTRSKVATAEVHQADLLDTNFDAGLLPRSEVGTCIEVLEHLDDPAKFLNRATQLVIPGGTFIVTVPSGPRTAFDRHIGHRRHFSPNQLRLLLEGAGLVNVRVSRYGWPFFNLYRILVLLRGEKLIRDVEAGSVAESKLTRATAWFFVRSFRANLRSSLVGWQLVAVGNTVRHP
jgi:2-polyprenyl-3-methyl-5-hydroxy-6-metoxy-1,4-benzoquinol methylase